MRRPTVRALVAVSADGATTGFPVDVAAFYRLAAREPEDVTLTGADTILAQEPALAGAPQGPGPAADGPLLAVVDGRCRVGAWAALRDAGHWRDVVALRSRATGAGFPREIVTGTGRVDLAAALDALAADGARTVRVDSGGALIGALLAAGLLDGVGLLVHPHVAGSGTRWTGGGDASGALEQVGVEQLDGGLVLVSYRVTS